MTSTAKLPGADIQLSVSAPTAELEQTRAQVRSFFHGMSDDALAFANAQDRLDRSLIKSNGKITSSVRSAEQNLRRVEEQAVKSSESVSVAANRTSASLERVGRGAVAGSGALHGLGRSALYAGAGFIGAYGLEAALRTSIEQAETGAKAHAALAAALEKVGGDAKRSCLRSTRGRRSRPSSGSPRTPRSPGSPGSSS
jgi:hypothetical protein